MRIVLDAMGSDTCPDPEVQASLEAAELFGDEIILVGPADQLEKKIIEIDSSYKGVQVVNATDAITMNDKGLALALKAKRNNSKTSMAIGERIHFFRTMRGMTQKYLGLAVGFPERSADVRLAQYETGSALLSYEKLQELNCKFFKQDRQAAEKQIKENLDNLDVISFTELYNTFYRLHPNTNFKRRLKDNETTI